MKSKLVKKKVTNNVVVNKYVKDILAGKKIACKELKQACARYRKDLKNKKFEFKSNEADEIIETIEDTIVFVGGEDINGLPFNGKPFLLQPWQKFIVYNLFGFYNKGTNIRRFTEALVFIPKKNGKTPFAGALAWASAVKYAKSESRVLLTSFTQQQSMFTFDFIKNNLEQMGILPLFKVKDNNMEHSLEAQMMGGKIRIQAFSGDPKDGLNGNFVIADEIHQFRNEEQYSYYQKAMKAYRNKLMMAITTAGEDPNSFCYQRLQTCKKILDGEFVDENYFVFITKADQDKDGNCNHEDPIEHEKANPGYNVTVMGYEIEREAKKATFESQAMKAFLAKELNIYTSSTKSFFDIEKFIMSDEKYNWSFEELAALPISWTGGVDLSKLHDLTSAVLFGTYKGIDIIIPHAWFPVVRAHERASKSKIPLFEWQKDGWLDMCNSETIHYSDVVNWFNSMRIKGLKIPFVRYDNRFGEEFIEEMKKERFNIQNQSQMYIHTTKGFNRIHNKALEGKLYYLHSEAFEYCVKNIKADEKPGGFYQFDKIHPESLIDIFAASVFAATGSIENSVKVKKFERIIGNGQ